MGVRKACYRCLEHQVPVEAVSFLVKPVVEGTTGVVIDEMPSVGTISNMTYAMGVVNDIYVGQVLMSELNLCLGLMGLRKMGSTYTRLMLLVQMAPLWYCRLVRLQEEPQKITRDTSRML